MSDRATQPVSTTPMSHVCHPLLTCESKGTVPTLSFNSALEAYISVICACLPRIYILFSRLYRKYRLTTDPQMALPTHPMVSTLPYIIQSRHNIDPESCPRNGNQSVSCSPETNSTETDSDRQGVARLCRYSNATSSDFSHLGELYPWTSETPCMRPASV